MENEMIYKIKPKFNIFYELFMPTGSKLRNTLFVIILCLIGYIIFIASSNSLNFNKILNVSNNINIESILNKTAILILVLLAIKFIIHLVVQILQYKSISYTFYIDNLVYEDSFLNQHKKTLRYADVKEIEIRRTIWDRINGYGIIVIYTNAEKSYSNGLILYAIKNPEIVYSKIDEIIHTKNNNVEENIELINDTIKKETDFLGSIKNKE
ncbi:MAG: PH domain-containing protein [Clostridia bacterium]